MPIDQHLYHVPSGLAIISGARCTPALALLRQLHVVLLGSGALRGPFGDSVQVDDRRAISRAIDKITDQLDGLKLWIFNDQAGRMGEEIEHAADFDRPLNRQADRLEKVLPSLEVAAKSRHVANRAHGNFQQATRVEKWLGFTLGANDVRVHSVCRRFLRFTGLMTRVLGTDPFEAKGQK